MPAAKQDHSRAVPAILSLFHFDSITERIEGLMAAIIYLFSSMVRLRRALLRVANILI